MTQVDPLLADLIAFYLPQYHPIEENNDWWGTGFTEWTNVAKARPAFRGHYQPHYPTSLGYYDLRVQETRELQAEMARRSGIAAFAYYHYWFNGHRLLERPMEDVVRSRSPQFPFLCVWANENWTRTWDGGAHEVLIRQQYSARDDLAHIQSLRPYLLDDRYYTRNGKPVVCIYRSSRLPNPTATCEVWRREAERWGLPGLYILSIESFLDEVGDPRPRGFDAAIHWQPSSVNTPKIMMRSQIRRKLSRFGANFTHRLYRYEEWSELARAVPMAEYPRWPSLFVGFDNSARRSRDATIVVGNTPALYEEWLGAVVERATQVRNRFEPGTPPLAFVNAWNEWAEGNHLEPDRRNGSGFLEATRTVLHRGHAIEMADPLPIDSAGASARRRGPG